MSLWPPATGLRMSVVVPAKDEQERIAACLDALAEQRNTEASEYEVLLVLDGCTDSTAEVVERWRRTNDVLPLHVLRGPARGVGFARKLGMDTAYSRLLRVGNPAGLISSTDADSLVAENWVSAQLRLAESGSRAIGGFIELENGGADLPPDILEWYVAQGNKRYERVLEKYAEDSAHVQEHWYFSGASMAVTADVYRKIGGLGYVDHLEDEHLESELEAAGVRITRSSSVRVTTSSRTTGRSPKGLAADLNRASSTLYEKVNNPG